jgi:hypothetical protein
MRSFRVYYDVFFSFDVSSGRFQHWLSNVVDAEEGIA